LYAKTCQLWGIDIALLGKTGGNIALMNPDPIKYRNAIILLDNAPETRLPNHLLARESTPLGFTMGFYNLAAKKIFLWRGEKTKLTEKNCVKVRNRNIPASYKQTHNDAHVVIDLSAAAILPAYSGRGWLLPANGMINSLEVLLYGFAPSPKSLFLN
jgi:glucosamine-6-phosphate deaminase